MTDEQQSPVSDEAGDEAVRAAQEQQPEAVADEADTQGQVEPQPAEDDQSEETRSQRRKRRRQEERERLIREKEAAEARAAEVEARLAKYEQRQPPREADFRTYDEYQAALMAYNVDAALDKRDRSRDEAEAEAAKREAEAARSQVTREAQENWAAQVREAKQRYSDFEQVAFTAPISDEMADMIIESDHAADVAYHLGKNPDQARLLSQLTGPRLAREIGRIEAIATMAQPKTVTSAPAPVSPVMPKSTPAVKDPQKMSMAEYAKWRANGGGK